MACYESSLKGVVKEDFEREVDKWIEVGVPVPWEKRSRSGRIAFDGGVATDERQSKACV